ncbi:hypothetical protein [Paenibacillus chitinolyticus]|nr:hypothetical protein [Paenibacillus chitinolyticus]
MAVKVFFKCKQGGNEYRQGFSSMAQAQTYIEGTSWEIVDFTYNV